MVIQMLFLSEYIYIFLEYINIFILIDCSHSSAKARHQHVFYFFTNAQEMHSGSLPCNATLQLLRIIAHIIVVAKTHRPGITPFRICCGSMCLTRRHCTIVFGMNKQVDNWIAYVLYPRAHNTGQ